MIRRVAILTHKLLRFFEKEVPETSKAQKRRGVALLLVLVSITLMSATVVEFSYQTRVDLAMSANQRDKLKSEYLAKSAVNIARLFLGFQFALENESGKTQSAMGQQISNAMARSNFQMYQYIDLLMGPFNSGKIESPVGGVNLSDSGVEGFGDFVGDMEAKVIPEDGRFNLNAFAKVKIDGADVQSMCSLFLNSQYESLFERKDPYTDEVLDRGTMVSRIIDFIDDDNQRVTLSPECTIEGSSGDENRIYAKWKDKDKIDVEPKNAKLTHVAELRQVPGVDDAFFQVFEESFTVYPVGKPNVNVAKAGVFYSVLCQNVYLTSTGPSGQRGLSLCSSNPVVATQVLWFALAMEGVKTFFEDPMTVLLGYVGSTESRLLPSARKGQPVAFIYGSQLSGYISDMKADPVLMAKFLLYSPTYSTLVAARPEMAINPLTPVFPKWEIEFDRSGLLNSITTDTPKIYRIRGIGKYGATETTVEAVLDFGKTLRRLPPDLDDALEGNQAKQQVQGGQQGASKILTKREQLEKEMPKGRFLYWHQE